MRKLWSSCGILVGNSEGKRPVGRSVWWFITSWVSGTFLLMWLVTPDICQCTSIMLLVSPIVAGFLSTHNDEEEVFSLVSPFIITTTRISELSTTRSADFFSQNPIVAHRRVFPILTPLPFFSPISLPINVEGGGGVPNWPQKTFGYSSDCSLPIIFLMIWKVLASSKFL
jgi:hypothetical protein